MCERPHPRQKKECTRGHAIVDFSKKSRSITAPAVQEDRTRGDKTALAVLQRPHPRSLFWGNARVAETSAHPRCCSDAPAVLHARDPPALLVVTHGIYIYIWCMTRPFLPSADKNREHLLEFLKFLQSLR